MNEVRNSRFFNNPIAALIAISLVPFLGMLAGIYVVTQYGRVPGGTTTTCARRLDYSVMIQLERYTYLAGLSTFELQTFSISYDQGQSWEQLIKVDVQEPRGITCETAIMHVDSDVYALVTRKAVALSYNGGVEWRISYVCEDLYLISGRCDDGALDIFALTIAPDLTARVIIHESIIDEYGKPITQNGDPLLSSEYIRVTSDGGNNWNIANES